MASKRAIWARQVQAWERSGLSRRAFCAARGLNVHTLDYWRRVLRSSPALVPVVAAPRSPAASGLVEVVLPNGIRLQVPSGSDLVSLRALVQALGTC